MDWVDIDVEISLAGGPWLQLPEQDPSHPNQGLRPPRSPCAALYSISVRVLPNKNYIFEWGSHSNSSDQFNTL